MKPRSSANTSPRRNIELKARCADLAKAAAAAKALGASAVGTLVQTDTYFHASTGRLKLRETDGKPAELIAYARANSTDFRGSDYHLVPVSHPSEMKTALTAALGIRGTVHKRRELLMWHNVRIHLDAVDGLGTFVEFEAVISTSADEPIARERLATLTTALAITPADRIAVSYSDLAGI